MNLGRITLPRPEKDLLIKIRTGQYGSLDHVMNLAKDRFLALEQAESRSDLPETVDREAISRLVSETYLRHWNGSAETNLR